MVTADALKVGTTRVQDGEGFIGTVLYVGPVASAKNRTEVYAGIAWDDVSRGKHDGSVICRETNQEVRHFSCPSQAGSFLRLSKLDTGVALDETALKERYVNQDAPVVAPNNLLPHSARTSGGREKPIEFLGELKIRARQQLPQLDCISLRSMGISRAVLDESSVSEFQHLKELDLAGNLIGDWETVFRILKQFPNLQKVSFASNRLQDIPHEIPEDNVDFSMLKVVNLNACSIKSLRTVQWLAQAAQNLEELCLAYSDLSSIDVTTDSISGLEKLRSLDCSSCGITSWEKQVIVFVKLPCLQQLSLDDNAISRVPMTSQEDEHFASLFSLQLAGTAIASWTDLDGVRSLKSLRSLRFKGTRLTSNMGAGEARALTIARLPNIHYLNASPVSSQERIEAERRYVSNVARDLVSLSVAQQGDNVDALKSEMLLSHPEFPTLVLKHKESMAHATQSFNETEHAAPLALNITIRSMAPSCCNMAPLEKRIPCRLTVGRLKILCSRAFGIDIDLQALHYRGVNDAFPIEMDNDENTLAYYGICDGAEILVNEVDMEALARQKASEKEDLDRRIEEQENDARKMQELQRMSMTGNVVSIEKQSSSTNN